MYVGSECDGTTATGTDAGSAAESAAPVENAGFESFDCIRKPRWRKAAAVVGNLRDALLSKRGRLGQRAAAIRETAAIAFKSLIKDCVRSNVTKCTSP